jgi:hypothetical protein
MKVRSQKRRQMELSLEELSSSKVAELPVEARHRLLSALAEMLLSVATARQTTSPRRLEDEIAQGNR